MKYFLLQQENGEENAMVCYSWSVTELLQFLYFPAREANFTKHLPVKPRENLNSKATTKMDVPKPITSIDI